MAEPTQGSPKGLHVDPTVLVDQAALVGRHQQSWQYLLAGQAPQLATSAFGEGLSGQAQHIAGVLDSLHAARQRQTDDIQQAARLASRFARQVDDADATAGQDIGRVWS